MASSQCVAGGKEGERTYFVVAESRDVLSLLVFTAVPERQVVACDGKEANQPESDEGGLARETVTHNRLDWQRRRRTLEERRPLLVDWYRRFCRQFGVRSATIDR
jgi:hypothetical protein